VPPAPVLEIPAPWRPIVLTLLHAEQAWLTPAGLARRLQRDAEALTDVLAVMDRDGWLQVWEQPESVMVTLSAWAARGLGARLVCAGPGGWRWAARQLPPGRHTGRPRGRRRPALPARVGAG
jgi:hypothetical protein